MLDIYFCRCWSHWHNLSSEWVLPRHRISNCLGTPGENQLESQASPWLELPADVRQGQGLLLSPTGGRSIGRKGWRLCSHWKNIHLFLEFHIDYQTFCPWKNCRKEALVCYRLWPLGFLREDVQVGGPSLGGQLLPHVLQRPTGWGWFWILKLKTKFFYFKLIGF